MKQRLVLMLSIDVLLALVAQYSALNSCFAVEQLCRHWSWGQFIRVGGVFAASVLFASYLMEVYTLDRRCTRLEICIKCFQSSVVALFLLILVYYVAPFALLGHGVIFLSVGFFFLYQSLWHGFSALAVKSPHFQQRVLILGSGQLARQLGDLVLMNDTPFTLAGYLAWEAEGGGKDAIHPELLLPKGADLVTTALRARANLIVVALAERRGVLPLQEMMQCKLEGVKVVDAPLFYEMLQEKLMLEEMTPGYIIFSSGFQRTRIFKIFKRCFDMLLAVLGLLFSLPLFPFVAIAIKLDSKGPVLFKQVRVGSAERSFLLYKFRSMRVDAERDGAVWAAEHDDRVTRVGRFLRQFRIDELPQLYNVLKGDMSFIGPRPERPEFVEMLKKEIGYYSKRHTIKPGLTGWAQVRYPYGATTQDALEKLRYDLYYIKNISIFLDSQIFFETLKVVLFGRGGR